jgi:AcrR family transcriptional regulator
MGVQERKAREFSRREQEIVGAALELFRGDEWQTVTVEQIAQRAEIGKGTVYKHFSSKDEIYARIALDFQRTVLAAVRRVETSLPFLERFRAMLRVAWDAHLTSQELHRVVVYCFRQEFRANLSPGTAREFADLDKEWEQLLGDLIEQGMEVGAFPRRPLPLRMFGTRATFWGAVQLAWSGPPGDFDRELHQTEIADFILGGLGCQNPHPAG